MVLGASNADSKQRIIFPLEVRFIAPYKECAERTIVMIALFVLLKNQQGRQTMEVKLWKIRDVKPYEKNPRRNDSAVDAVAASIQEFGWKQPIVVDKDGIIIAGHTRYKAAKKLKMKDVPVVVADDLTEEQVRAYRLADNKTGELAGWDFSALEEELSEFTKIGMEQFGFSQDESVFDLLENDKNGDVMSLGNDDLVADYFDVTFAFNKMYESQIKDYIKENGKTPLIEAILRETGGCSK